MTIWFDISLKVTTNSQWWLAIIFHKPLTGISPSPSRWNVIHFRRIHITAYRDTHTQLFAFYICNWIRFAQYLGWTLSFFDFLLFLGSLWNDVCIVTPEWKWNCDVHVYNRSFNIYMGSCSFFLISYESIILIELSLLFWLNQSRWTLNLFSLLCFWSSFSRTRSLFCHTWGFSKTQQ